MHSAWLLVALCLTATAMATYCPSVMSKYMGASECPLAADPIDRFHKLLSLYFLSFAS
jgi:hypothetical protein